ncbi:uncharacterized protein [Spinacia oleracea]|uniref:Integrase zinc-binding domain-containing protein n=1 Tax=Spinacia oleracea TaxID=3562 RepID=A0ABM3QUW5_SPIOL|nr:uncharacterized protein LOC130462588 [Spinacia oleracea]
MTNLMKKESKFEWSEKCEEDFQILKERLTSAPVLTMPDGNEGFEVYSDASKNGLGCVLQQNGKYHEGKANVVADALSRKSSQSMNVLVVPEELCRDMQRLSLEIVKPGETKARLSALSLGLSIFEEIKESQAGDEYLEKIKEKMGQGKEVDFKIHDDGSLRFKGRWCVPQKYEELKRRLMDEGHNTPYSVHPGGDKLYKDLKQIYWWPNMKREVADHSTKWTGSESGSRKAPVAWEQLCFPKSNGGWNLKDLTIWNKAAVMKHCWALSMKQGRLWVRWIHTY